MADFDSGPVLQVNTRQQIMILDEGLCTLPKTLKDRKKRRLFGSVQIKHLVIEFRPIKDIGDNFRAIAIVV